MPLTPGEGRGQGLRFRVRLCSQVQGYSTFALKADLYDQDGQGRHTTTKGAIGQDLDSRKEPKKSTILKQTNQ